MRLSYWEVYPPADPAFTVIAYTEKEARYQARFYLGTGKLPKGTNVYRGTMVR